MSPFFSLPTSRFRVPFLTLLITQHRIVTPSGQILDCSATSNPDLFWALRGGGGNFGVVTEFIFNLHPQRKTVYCGPLIYTPDKLEALMGALRKWWDGGIAEKEAAGLIFTVGPDRLVSPDCDHP